MARMRERQHAAALRPATPVPGPDTGPLPMPEVDADGVTIVDPMPELTERVKARVGPSEQMIQRAVGTMWWAAQSPAIAEDQRARLLEARATVLQENALV